MKKGSLIAIIIGLVSLISAIIGALYVLKKRGILFTDDDYDYDFDDFDDDEPEITEAEDLPEEPEGIAKKKKSADKAENNDDTSTEQAQ